MRADVIKLWEISFGKALFISILWHLFWISSVTIVSLPAKVQYPHFSSVSFLGPLLDAPNFEVHVSQKPPLRGEMMRVQEWVDRSPFQGFPEETVDLLKIDLSDSERSPTLPNELLGLEKRNPTSFSKEDERLKKETSILSGPAASRILYYQPPLPELPKWLDPQEVRSSFELRFWVTPRGKVVGIEKVTSSGDPTLDLIGMRYLRRWQFNPKTTEQEEWGTVTLHFPISSSEVP